MLLVIKTLPLTGHSSSKRIAVHPVRKDLLAESRMRELRTYRSGGKEARRLPPDPNRNAIEPLTLVQVCWKRRSAGKFIARLRKNLYLLQ